MFGKKRKVNGPVELGDRVVDKITKLKGVVIGITKWLYGCTRIVIQPEQAKDGKPAENFCIDLPQADLVKKSVLPQTASPETDTGELAELGDRVEDRITKVRGVVIGLTHWIYGSTRVVIQPEEAKDGKPAEGFNIDRPQAKLIAKAVVVPPYDEAKAATPEPARRPGGPRNDPARGQNTVR